MGIILFAILCIIDIILLSSHWYIPFFLLSLYLFLQFCVAVYYRGRVGKKQQQQAMKQLLLWRYRELTGKDWVNSGNQE